MPPFAIPAAPFTGSDLQSYRAFDFSGGLDVQTSPKKLALLKENRWLLKATNVVYNDDGSVSKRWGMIAKSDMHDGATDAKFLGGTRFVLSGGTAYDVVASTNGNVYKLVGTTLTSIKSGLTSVRKYTFAVYNDLLHIGNGTDAPQKWDGTTWAALGGSSPATAHVLVAHGNRMFATATAVPSRLYWSKLNATTDWAGTTDAGFLDVNPSDGGNLLALVPGIQELVMLKTLRPYRLQGIGPTTGYTVADNMVPAGGSIGATSMTAAEYAAGQVYYASQMGIHTLAATNQFGDLREEFISHRIEPYFRGGGTTYSPWEAISYQGFSGFPDSPFVTYDPRNNLLFCASRASSLQSACDRFLVYDLNLKAWAHWNLLSTSATGFTCMFQSESETTHIPEMTVGLYSSGPATNHAVLASFRRDQTSDLAISETAGGSSVAIAISATVRHVSCLGDPRAEKSPRYLYLHFAKESSSTIVTVNLYADFKTTAVFTTTVDITSSTAETHVVKRVDLSSIACIFLEVELVQATAAKTFTFYGYEVEWRVRRIIHRAE
jgi:hypothetical protein